MITIEGIHNTAICYTEHLEDTAREQIRTVCDRPEFSGCKIRIMPDVHAGDHARCNLQNMSHIKQ